MSNEHQREPAEREPRRPIRPMPGGGNLPITPNFSYQPGNSGRPDRTTTAVEITFTPKPGKEGWTWKATAADFPSKVNGVTVSVPPNLQGVTSGALSLDKGELGQYFGLFVTCTDGTSTESEGLLYGWSDGAVQSGWSVNVDGNDTVMSETQVG